MLVWRLLAMLLALCSAHADSDFAWEPKRMHGRDYVAIDKVAAFYNLPTRVAPIEKRISLARGGRSLTFTRDSREIEINGIKHWISFPIVESDGKYWVARLDLGKTIEPALRPELIPGLKPFTTVVLDAGHGGHDKGARGPYEVEKNFALDLARRVRNELQKSGLRVVLTRNADTFIELHDRAAMANAKPDSIFVSLHFNAADWNRDANGFEIFCITPRGSPSTEYNELLVRDMVQEYGNQNELQSFALANAIYHAMHGSTKMFDRGVKRARFAVLRLTKMPAVLVEGGFLTNANDARLVASTAWRDTYAKSIANGILEYKKLVDQKVAPKNVADYRSPAAPPAKTAQAMPPVDPSVTLRELPPASN